jgi:hypothetical protein
VPGNHDVLCQGTSLVSSALDAVATGGTKGLLPPPGFLPDDPLTLFVEAPEAFLGTGDRAVTPHPGRRGITLNEWIERHVLAGAAGLSAANVAAGSPDAVVALDAVTVITLDTNHPAGDYQGSIAGSQLDWLEDQLSAADAAGRLVVLASHHGPDALVNTRGDDPARHLAGSLLDVVHRHACVVAWLVGHRHINRVVPRPGAAGGFWEITTASIIDWPVERRSVDIVAHANGTIEIAASMHAHGAPDGSLAAIHRGVAQHFAGSQVRGAMAGADVDRDVRLFLSR